MQNTQEYRITNGVLYAAKPHLREAIIPEGVGTIAAGAFCDQDKLYRITLPSTLQRIEAGAFRNCCYLVEIVNHSSLDVKPRWGQWGGLTDYAESVVCDLGDSRLTVADDLVLLSQNECLTLVRYMGRKQTLALPQGITHIGDEAFANTVCREVLLPPSVQAIGHKAFYCAKIRRLALPHATAVVAPRAFDCSDIEQLSIACDQVTLGTECFDHTYELTDVFFGGTIAQWQAAFDDAYTCGASFTLHASDGTASY